jgi:multidrug efflux pump subunit AcrB
MSLIHPLTTSRPCRRRAGALDGHGLVKSNLDIVGMIGIILLIGIVKKTQL